MFARASLLLVAAASFFVMACSSSGALCEKEKECMSDPPGEDFVSICTIKADGQLRALNANKEEECHLVASTLSALNACRAQLDCDDYNEFDYGGHCDDELDDYLDAVEDADNECTALD